jgi:adenylate cyclase
MVLAAVCRLLPAFAAALAVVALGTLYLAAADYQFKSSGTWYPLAIPLMFQMPVAFFGTLWWKYIDTQRERRNIRRAFGYYLPDRVVDELARGMGKVGTSSQMVHGTCMCTDGEQYVSLSEMMSPKELTLFMNRYYETVFKPVKEHGGIISDVVGDSMMAIWATSHPDAALRTQACLASVDIADAVKRFNRSSDNPKLPTRIGMHSGLMSLGSIGGVNHYEYRAVGDVVNTAARIEGLNKVLGTQILASYEVIEQLSGLLTRELGSFVLAGKSKPVEIHELLCRMEHSSEEQRKLCAAFGEALDAYRKQYLGEARALFQNCLEIAAEDGPSRFYKDLCKKNVESPPEEGWDGLIYMNKK